MAVRIPWTEKYRPLTLDDVVGNPNIIATLKGFILTQVVPQLIILWGLPGIGKTSAAFAFARDYYIRKGVYDEEGKLMPDFFPPLLVMRGSVSIEEIRGMVHEFMRHAPPKGARRIIIFDEAEMISRAALLELRPYIERYAKTCSIIFTTNVNPAGWLDMFDPLLAALRDRALIYHFLQPTTDEIARHLRRIVREEEFEIPEEKIRSIAVEAEGSVRKAIELLQAEYARIIAVRPPEVDWAMAWADYNVVSRNFDVFPSEMRIEVKKFVREWERKYGKGIKAMGAPLQPCTVEDAERMEQYSDYVAMPPEVPEVPVPPPVAIPPPVEKGLRKADEDELRTEFKAELLRRTISPRKWMPIFEDELIKWRREYAEFPRDVAKVEVKTDLLRLIPDVVGLAKPPEIKPPVPEVRRPPREIRAPRRIEIGVEREPEIVTRRCWICDEPFEADRDLEKRVRETITTVRGPRDVIYQEPLLGFKMLFYYLCEEHRDEQFGYRDIYDALAFQLAEARSSGYKKLTLTKEVLRDRGFTPEDLREIQVRVTRWLP